MVIRKKFILLIACLQFSFPNSWSTYAKNYSSQLEYSETEKKIIKHFNEKKKKIIYPDQNEFELLLKFLSLSENGNFKVNNKLILNEFVGYQNGYNSHQFVSEMDENKVEIGLHMSIYVIDYDNDNHLEIFYYEMQGGQLKYDHITNVFRILDDKIIKIEEDFGHQVIFSNLDNPPFELIDNSVVINFFNIIAFDQNNKQISPYSYDVKKSTTKKTKVLMIGKKMKILRQTTE